MKTRRTIALSNELDRKLMGYVTAATSEANTARNLIAAISAVGMAVATPVANAEIAYTPANQSFGNMNGPSYLPIDLNNDGIADVTLSAYNLVSFSSGGHIFHFLGVEGDEQSNEIVATSQGLVAPDVQGQIIGEENDRQRFQRGGLMAECHSSANGYSSFFSNQGLWFQITNRYLGVKFLIDGETHYGWARLNAGPGGATLTGYAYETIPDRPIPAGVFETAPGESSSGGELEGPERTKPVPATLGALARGARRKGSLGCRA